MIFTNLLLAFQLENYNNSRFLSFIYSRPWFWLLWSERQSLDWTKKAILLLFLAGIFAILDYVIFYLIFVKLWIIILILLALLQIILFPIYLVIANFLLIPLDRYLKNKIINKAKNKLKKYNNLKIIWITGSYWKTSTKEVLKEVLSVKYKVLASEWNKNTPLWISEVILKTDLSKYEVLIVEMGAYEIWDIAEMCDIVEPTVWVLTWITYQHLERFKSIENIKKAKFELPEFIDKSWLVLLDYSNEHIADHLDNKANIKAEIIKIKDIEVSYADNFMWFNFDYNNKSFYSKLLAWHSAKNFVIAYEIWKYFNIKEEKIIEKLAEIEPVEHRLSRIENPNTGVIVIDDSYNWNFEGVKSTINMLKNVNNSWKKLYLTPWLVELWDKSKQVHLEIWKLLTDAKLDKVLLIENKGARNIEAWLLKSWFDKENIVFFDTTQEAHKNIWKYLNNSDAIVFQNDFTDNYF